METTATTRTASSRLQAAIAALREIDLPADGEAVRSAALEVAEIVRTLDADDEVVIAAMIQPLLDGSYIEREGAVKRFGEEPLRLAEDARLFVGCHNKTMLIVEAGSGKVAQALPIGEGVDAVVFDARTRQVFSSQSDGTLTILQGDAAGKFSVQQNVATQRGARREAVIDRAGGRSHRSRDGSDGGSRGAVGGDDPARGRQDLILVELRSPRHR